MGSEFWQKVRKAAQAVSHVFNGRATTEAIKHATPMQRAFAVGAIPGQPVSNKWEELGHDTSWNYVGIHTVAKMWALASWVAYDTAKVIEKNRRPGMVTKAAAQDAPSEQRTPNHDHEAIKLLDRPNPVMSRMQFMYIIATHLRLTGGWAILEVRGKDSHKPVELYPIPRAWMTFWPPTKEHPMGEWLIVSPRTMTGHSFYNPLASGFRVDARDMIIGGWPHPMFPGEQISPLTACARIIDIMEQMDLAVWSSLLNAYHNGMILLMDPKAMVDEPVLKRITETVQSTKGGAGQAGKVSALQGVASIERPSIPLSELSAVEVRNQNKDFGLGIQGVPSVATGIRSEVGSYAGDAATFNAFAEWGIQPDLDLFAGCLTMRWKHHYGDDFELEASAKRHDDPQLDQQNSEQIFQAVQAGGATWNEWRATKNLPPIPGGDEIVQPQPQAVGPDGQPIPEGMPDPTGMGMQAEDDLGLDVDLPELADEESPNNQRPDLSRGWGRSFAPNGRG